MRLPGCENLKAFRNYTTLAPVLNLSFMNNNLFAFSAALFLFSSFQSSAQEKISVITQHNNNYRNGWNNKETILTPVNVSSPQFGIAGSLSVDDQVYAQPLIARNVTIGGFTGSVLFAATVNNTLYAFNADDVSYGAPLWQISLNPAGEHAPQVKELKDDNYGAPCGGNYQDISGRFGIIGTPVIDTNTNTLYVATKTVDGAGNFHAYMNAVDITTGLHKTGSPKRIEAAINGNGEGSSDRKINYNAKLQNQRPGLLLYNNTVYVASASYCDWGPYHGWILGYDASTLALKYTFNTTPNGWAGGIWMAGQGISVGDDGNLYVVTGNGTTSPDNTDLSGGRSESLIKLTPQLQMLDWFTPANYEYLDIVDLDYGCDGAMIIPNSSLTISGSKEGISYVVDYNIMSRYTPGNSQVLDTLEFNPGRTGYVHVHGSPVYAGLGTNDYVYAWSESYKLRQFTLDKSSGTFSNIYKEGTRTLDYGMPGAMLSVSSNGSNASSGIIWASYPTSGDANHQVRPGTIAAYRAGDVSAGELWNSSLHKEDDLGKFAKFNYPTIANGKVFVPTFSNSIKIYGLKCAGSLTGIVYDSGSGLKGEYFTNSSSSDNFPATATIARLDDINFNWGSGSPDPAISNDMFKARWTGKLKPLTNDTYTIYITASDGIRLWINNKLLIDSWTDKPATVHSVDIAMQRNAEYDIRLEYYSNTNSASCILQWSAGGICKQNIPASQLFPNSVTCSSNGTGLLAEYFSNSNPADSFPAKATVVTTAPGVFFNWDGDSPDGISADNFKARFTGYIQSLDAGTYNFYLTGDDGVRLWINNQLIIDGWVDQPPTEYTAKINLDACRKYPVKIEYYENGGGAVCKLEWSGPSVERQAVPMTQLFTQPDALTTKDLLIYPNPAKGSINAAVKTVFKNGDVILMYGMAGQLVRRITISPVTQGSSTIIIPVSDLAAGIYIVKLVKEGQAYMEKVVITR